MVEYLVPAFPGDTITLLGGVYAVRGDDSTACRGMKLADYMDELPGEGWPTKYLRDCHGDHGQAIRKYLDFAAEFAALQE